MDLDYKKLVDLAFELHSKNDFDKAEEIYKALLEVNPDDVNIINLYGMLCLSKNRADEAVSFFSRALILKKLPYIASNLAKAFYIKNDFDNALKFYKQALEFGESDDIYYSMAITYKQLKRYKDAILCYNRALKLNPNNYNALYNLSILYSEKKDIQKAIDTAIKCTFVKDSEELRTLLSGYFEEQKDYKNAIKQLKKAVEFNNKNYLYFYNLGVLYSRTGHVDSAVTNYKKAFKLNPQNIESYVNLSALYAQTNRELSLKYIKIAYEYAPNEENVILALAKAYKDNNCNKESMYILKDYLAKNSKCAEAYLLLAINNMDLGNYQEALNLYEKAISLEPKNLNYIHGKAIALKYLGNWEESKQLLEKIVKKSEILTQTKVALGMMYLTEKNFDKGMPLYIKRSLDTKFSQIFKDKIYNKSIDLSDKTVLLFSDCGLGDTIMCARYLPEIVKKSKSVVLQTDKELVDILQYNFPMVKVISKSEKYNNYDTVMPIMDIMYALNSDFNSIPLSQGYIKPVKFKQKKYSELFNTKNKKVGICFRGNNKIFKNRLIPFENVRVLFNIPGITYYSFQMKKDRHNFSNLVNLKNYINDYSDTCSLLSNIDIMLTIDSSIAHMAGAMGKTVFLLLPKTAEWRWFNDEETTPWYDSIKIFKQTESGNWNEVIKRVCKELLIYESK